MEYHVVKGFWKCPECNIVEEGLWKVGWMAGFRFTASDWLHYPAIRLAGLQRSDWLAFRIPIGHNYTLIYAVVIFYLSQI